VNFGFSSTYIALWIVVVFQGLLIVALLHKLEKVRLLIERGTALPIGSDAPAFSGVDQAGRLIGLQDLAGGGVILFLSPDCPLCKGLVNSISTLGKKLPRLIAICRGEGKPCSDIAMLLESQVILDEAGEIAASYGTTVFPRAVMLDSNKKIRGYSFPKTIDDLSKAFNESLGDGSAEPGSELPTPAAGSA
jgi:AhpC/TSA family